MDSTFYSCLLVLLAVVGVEMIQINQNQERKLFFLRSPLLFVLCIIISSPSNIKSLQHAKEPSLNLEDANLD